MSFPPAFSVEGQVVVVTGGAAGIGLGMVEAFDQAGAKVLAVGRRANGAEVISKVAPNARYFQADLADASSADAIVAAAVREFGRVDTLINNAAQLENHPVGEYTVDYIDRMMNTNIRAVLLLIQAFVAHCKEAGHGGRIINIGSLEGFVASLPAGMGVYSATKTAMRGMTVSLARELGPLGINVNCIAPGVIAHQNLFDRAVEIGHGTERLEAGMEALRAKTNAGRMGRPEDIANACLFFASPASNYVSGQTLLVDSGITVRGG
jgi:NAD(P)-dependent dehydrogenase (short-subunit alcohol dehydrogenase family)